MRRAGFVLLAAGLLYAQPPTGSIHGIVKDAVTGAPLSDFTIQVTQQGIVNKTPTTLSDDEGLYSLANIVAGSLTVIARNNRRETVTRTVQLNPGDDLPLDFVIPANPMISGRVVNGDKEPIPDVFVWVVQTDISGGVVRHSLMGPRVTQEDGSYTFSFGLTAGRKYYLVVDRPTPDELVGAKPLPLDERELIEAPTYFGDVTSLDAATPLVLQPSEHRESVDIKIAKAAYYCVDGAVDVSGRAASLLFSVHEQALAGTSMMRLHAESGEDGAFRICGLTSGQYLLSTSNAEGVAGAVDFTVAGADAHRLRLSVDMATLHLQLAWDGDPPPHVDPKSIFQGVRKEGDLWILPGAKGGENKVSDEQYMQLAIALSSQSQQVSVSLNGVTNAGRFGKHAQVPFDDDAGQMPAGDYALAVTTNGGCCYPKSMVLDGIPLSAKTLHLSPGVTSTLRILMASDVGKVICKVTDADGKPVDRFLIMVAPDGEDSLVPLPAMGLSLSSRAWELPPGKYRVLALHGPQAPSADMDKIWQAFSKATRVEVSSKGTVEVSLTLVSID